MLRSRYNFIIESEGRPLGHIAIEADWGARYIRRTRHPDRSVTATPGVRQARGITGTGFRVRRETRPPRVGGGSRHQYAGVAPLQNRRIRGRRTCPRGSARRRRMGRSRLLRHAAQRMGAATVATDTAGQRTIATTAGGVRVRAKARDWPRRCCPLSHAHLRLQMLVFRNFRGDIH